MPSKRARSGVRHRRQPQRTCISCRCVRPKRQLIRIVLTPDNTVQVDPTGKVSGRGAYLCAQRSCWLTALHGGRTAGSRVGQALKRALTADELAILEAYAMQLPQALPDAE